METIQVVLDERLLQAADKAVRRPEVGPEAGLWDKVAAWPDQTPCA